LTTGLSQRVAATGLALDTYIARLAQPTGWEELQHLAELVLNHETLFFRNQVHMQALRDSVLPALHQRKKPDEPIRIWSAGCSTGEEPYSLAITALESLGHPLPRRVQIWATDLSEAALAKAARGRYRGRSLTNVSPALRQRYFEVGRDDVTPRPHVRALVDFEQYNLLEPFPPQAQGMDIIFCQNVTIYFQMATFRNLIERFYTILPEGGMLFLGFSETLWNVFDKLHLQEMNGAFVYVKDSRPAPMPPRQAGTGFLNGETPQPQQTDMPVHGAPSRRRGTEPFRVRATSRRHFSSSHTSTVGAHTRAYMPGTTPLPHSQEQVSEAMQRGRELLVAGRSEEALGMLYQLPLKGNCATHVLTLIARAHANRGDIELAVAEARRALELDPLTMEAYLLLGILSIQQGHMSEASQYLERARYLDPKSALVSYHLAETYRQLQRREVALREYRSVLRKLTDYCADDVLDGVAVGWLRGACEQHIRT
jgi:chemotaxis protein methyltransferase CheR